MSYIEWETVADRQAVAGAPLSRRIETTTPEGTVETWQIGSEKCSHRCDGLICGYSRESHPMDCQCFSEHRFQ